MTRFILAGTLGAGDEPPHQILEGDVTPFSLVSAHRSLGRGIGTALRELKALGVRPSEIGVDLIVIAAHVYAADTRLNRITTSQDAWTREIGLIIPVSEPNLWTDATVILQKMLRFLTGDHWSIAFRPRPPGFESLSPQALNGIEAPSYDGISLFSGGLDSLIGAIDCVAKGQYPLFVSHAGEGAVSKPQRDLFEKLDAAVINEIRPNRHLSRLRFALTFPRNLVAGVGGEESTRGRSFLFLAMGALAGSGLPSSFQLRIPENGLIALNVPLDPTRIGSSSTRTTHPYYLDLWNELLSAVGIHGKVLNCYWDQTKGEMVDNCLKPKLLRQLTQFSVSCAHPALKRYHKDAHHHCGTCVPCLIRRAAIEAAWGQGGDPTGYRLNDLRAHPLDAARAEGQQVRGYQYALRRIHDDKRVARILVHKPGPLIGQHLAELDKFVGVYTRGMAEVAKLLDGVHTFSSKAPDH